MVRDLPKKFLNIRGVIVAATIMAFLSPAIDGTASAQDQDDPPGRVARLGYMQGSVSFQPAGENEWVEAVSNRPMTTGDKLWADRDSRAEVQLGSSMIDLDSNTGFSFLNLDDRTIQMEITAGSINVRVWSLDRDTVYEIDTPNQAFTVSEPGRYRVETSENGDYSVVTIWEGAGESTGNGQSYTLRAGQRTTFSGTNTLNAEVEQIENPDDFDRWSESRQRRYQDSPSARYCSRDVVGFEDLDDSGDWRSSPEYGEVWYPRVNAGWAPYHDGHWAWIDPWGWTWVDDDRWGYAPFHYGRWAYIGDRWGWVPGPRDVYPVYAPALVVFVGGGVAFGSNVAWFPLGPREVYVPSYHVSEAYVNRVNVSNTVVNRTTITNVYNTTIVNKNTTITNVKYVNRDVRGAVTVVPRQAFASAQPVSRAAVPVNTGDIARAPVSVRAAVPPAPQAVLGVHANTANRVAAPPQAIAQRPVIAKTAPPPPPPPFSARQQVLAQHPGEPVSRPELRNLRPTNSETASLVRRAPPGKPATPAPAPNRGAGHPGNPPVPNEGPGANTSATGRPQPGSSPPPAAQPNNRPESNRPEPSRPAEPPVRNDRPPTAQPSSRPEPNRPEPNRPAEPPRAQPAPRTPPAESRPVPPERQESRPQPQQEDKKHPDEPPKRGSQ